MADIAARRRPYSVWIVFVQYQAGPRPWPVEDWRVIAATEQEARSIALALHRRQYGGARVGAVRCKRQIRLDWPHLGLSKIMEPAATIRARFQLHRAVNSLAEAEHALAEARQRVAKAALSLGASVASSTSPAQVPGQAAGAAAPSP